MEGVLGKGKNKLCVFCYGRSESSGILERGNVEEQEEVISRFLGFLGKYLGTEFESDVALFGKRTGGGFGGCRECGSILQQFCDLSLQLERVKREMERMIEQLVENMEQANYGSPSKVERDQSSKRGAKKDLWLEIQEFRKDFMDKCRRKLLTSFLESPENVTMETENGKAVVTDFPNEELSNSSGDYGVNNDQSDMGMFTAPADDDNISEHSTELKYSPENEIFASIDVDHPTNAAEEEKSGSSDCLSCDFCPKQFTLRSSLRRHIRRTHPGKIKDKPVAKKSVVQDPRNVCSICSKNFSTKGCVIKHLRVVHLMDLTKAKSLFARNNAAVEFKPEVEDNQQEEPSLSVTKDKHDLKLRRSRRTKKRKNYGGDDMEPEEELRDKPVTCKICGSNFPGKISTVKHLRLVHLMTARKAGYTFKSWMKSEPPVLLPCSTANCSEEFGNEEHLQQHKDLHGTFNCHFCSTIKNYAPHLSSHELENHSLEPAAGASTSTYHCPRCPFTSSIRSTFNRHHIQVHLGLSIKALPCDICSLFLGSGDTTDQDHFLSHHDTSGVDPSDLQRCDKCPAHFKNMYQLIHHKRVIHRLEDKCCPLCGKIFSSTGNLRLHLQLVHKYDDESPQLPFPCPKTNCKRRFYTLEDKQKHEPFCSKSLEPIPCPECNRQCKGPEGLRTHMKSHVRKISYFCDQCGREFKRKNILDRHKLFHKSPEEWDYQCQCGKKCQTIYVLNDHMRTHTGEKPYQCKGCGNRYACRQKMRKHIEKYHKDEEEVQDIPRKKAKPKFVSKRGSN